MLTKSRVMANLQCPKKLWLEVHAPLPPKDTPSISLEQGNRVGSVARELYDEKGDGVFLDIQKMGVEHMLIQTQHALHAKKSIFEAAFTHDNCLTIADVLLHAPDQDSDGWHMIEVKSSTSVKDHQILDAAIQAHILKSTGLVLSKVSLAHINSEWTYPGDDKYHGLLQEVDQTQAVETQTQAVPDWIASAHATLQHANEPVKEMGLHCNNPNPCDYQEYCSKQQPIVTYPITWLPNLSAKIKNYSKANNAKSMGEVPDHLLSDIQLRVKKHTLSNTVYFDSENAKKALEPFDYPLYFLDFETIAFAVPQWTGTKPYEQVPFQFSLHVIESPNAQLQHHEFLDTTGDNPIPLFAQKLIECCGSKGAIFVYNKGFESARIGDLIKHHQSDLAMVAALENIKSRLVDLMPITKAHYYHYKQQGSWSIKKVLNAAFPELDYSNLAGVTNGMQAQEEYLKAIREEKTENRILEHQKMRESLLKYCERDTYAMVKIWTKLKH